MARNRKLATKPNIKFSAKEGYHSFAGGVGSFEVFWDDSDSASAVSFIESGWYWWACFPGCLPDGEASGPFTSSTSAWKDARV